ncbi:hypothetical protein O181_108273 [Austropuccinia psidii MF-1]|uniref:Uncharacterized protein n=1 Tax=Austropuccinia psidii MF-1 TaxID=1389203 RepID=A0A9Q3JU11_9BASI|nr:hypothetical protein [Austropuccinia psidii MF-1]
MRAIFGNKQNVIGHNVFDSTTQINKELDTDKHSINSYESDTESQGISNTEHSSEKDVSIEQSSTIVISGEDSQLEGSDQSTTAHKEQTNKKALSIKIISSKFCKRQHFGNQTQIRPTFYQKNNNQYLEIRLLEINNQHAFQAAELKFKKTTARNAQIALEESLNCIKLEYDLKREELEKKKDEHEIEMSRREE